MLWITLAVVSALLSGGYEVAKKIALGHNAVIPVLFWNVLLCAAVFLPLSLLSAWTDVLDGTPFHVPPIPGAAHAGIFLKSAVVLASWVFAFLAMKNLPIILTTSVKSAQPVFVLLGAIALFGEQLDGYQWAGVLTATAALVLLPISGRGSPSPRGRGKWVCFVLLSTLISAASSLWDKHLVAETDKMAVQVYTAYYELVLVVPLWLLAEPPRRRPAEPFRWDAAIVWVTVLLVVSDFFYFYSLSLDGALVSVVLTIRKAGVVVPFVAGIFLFREKRIGLKAVLLGMVLLGMGLLYFGGG